MKLSSVEIKQTRNGLSGDGRLFLGNIVVLAGSNGSGKTRLLKLLEDSVHSLQAGQEADELVLWISKTESGAEETPLTVENADRIKLVNYSHYDAQLQAPRDYTPYVISKASSLLQKYDYEETALNALLLLEDMANGYSPRYRDGLEWEAFVRDYTAPFHLELSRDGDGHPLLFDQKTDGAGLSPGQQYLLRMAVACYCNERNEKVIFLLDEPELHLHPQAQIQLIETLRAKFPEAQLWIATHSLALISFLTVYDKSTTVLYLSKGEVRLPRSNSSDLLAGLIGSEENRFAIRQLMASPDEYASNFFAVQCLTDPDVSPALTRNPQNDLLEEFFSQGRVILDFGVGKCRLLEEISPQVSVDAIAQTRYYAYDKYPKYADQAKRNMETYGSSASRYFNDKSLLLDKLAGQVDYVLMVNVLHEINPLTWVAEFDDIHRLLKEDGRLVIVEREELTIGEAPYSNGFLMMTPNGAAALFGQENCFYRQHSQRPHIVGHIIRREGLPRVRETLSDCLEAIHADALEKIREIKLTNAGDDQSRFACGIRLAFYLSQFANSSLIRRDLEEQNTPLTDKI